MKGLPLKEAISQNMVSHGYLFCGTHGIGKTTLARLVAKAVNGQNRGEGFFEGKIFASEPLGDRSYVDILWKERRLKAEVSPDFSGEANQRIFFKFNLDKFHLFDKNTGRSLRI